MSNYIAIDGGTTNTRIFLVMNGEISDVLKYSIGSGKSKNGGRLLKCTLKNGIIELLARNGLESGDIEKILVSGMLTSEYGIYDAPHITAPAGVAELHESTVKLHLDEISDIPFELVRGVKLSGADFESMDMMRGEETELIGLSEGIKGECVWVLPGSHLKVIKTDSDGRIVDFSTMLTGEMISALSQNTILKDAVSLEEASLNEEYLKKGFYYCEKCGINKALFKVRVLKNMFNCSKDEAYSFFVGAVLFGDVNEILKENPKRIAIGGNSRIKNAMYILLKHAAKCEVIKISDEAAQKANAIGMVKIAEYNKE